MLPDLDGTRIADAVACRRSLRFEVKHLVSMLKREASLHRGSRGRCDQPVAWVSVFRAGPAGTIQR